MPGRAEILRIMYEDADIAEAIGKMDPPDLRDDLRQEIFLVLAEMDEALLIQRYNEGWLRYYIVRTMLNMIKSDRSTFYNRFRRGFDELGDIGERMQDEGQDDAEKSIEGHLTALHWYERKLIEIYSENGRNVAKISRETGIPYRSLFKTIKKTKAVLKTEIKAGQAPELKVKARITIEIGIPRAGTTDDICDELDAFQQLIEAAVKSRAAFRRMGDLRITQTK